MNFKIGTRVIFRGSNGDLTNPGIKSGTITKIGRDTVWLDHAHKSEDQVYATFLYPDTTESHALLQEGIDLTNRQKKEQDEYMKKVYEFNNSLVRAGLK